MTLKEYIALFTGEPVKQSKQKKPFRAKQVNDVAAGEAFDKSLDPRAGNRPLQGKNKPPTQPVVMIPFWEAIIV